MAAISKFIAYHHIISLPLAISSETSIPPKMLLLPLLSCVFLFSFTVTAEEKCRLVRNTMMSCRDAKEADLPNKPYPNVEWLTLSKSAIPNIKNSVMKNLPKLTDFHAEGVGIEKIDDDAFKNLRSLNWVDVSSNKIRSISVNLLKDLPMDHFNVSNNPGLAIPERKPLLISNKLQWLDASSCEIKEVYSETFSSLPLLRDLSLAHNQLKTLPEDVFRKNPKIISLDLTGNKIKMLSDRVFLNLRTMVARFEDNPWDCDCKLTPLLKWSKRNVIKGEVKCDKPSGKKWKDIVDPAPCTPVK